MPDSEKLKQKVLLRILGSPATVLPLVIGMTTLVGTWAIDIRPDIGIFAGIAGVLGAAGIFLTKLILGSETYTKQALDEIHQESSADREQYLNDLEERLIADGDKRTESALHDLRSLTKAFEIMRNEPDSDLNLHTVFSIFSSVEDLFDQCVQTLERTLRLWYTAREMHTKAAKAPILKQREDMLRDVTNSIGQLGRIMATMQNLGVSEDASSEVERISKELDQHLVVARQVEKRMRLLEDQLRPAGRE